MEALSSPTVGHSAIAKEIEKEYICSTDSTSTVRQTGM